MNTVYEFKILHLRSKIETKLYIWMLGQKKFKTL